jgi:hypothetical protein
MHSFNNMKTRLMPIEKNSFFLIIDLVLKQLKEEFNVRLEILFVLAYIQSAFGCVLNT